MPVVQKSWTIKKILERFTRILKESGIVNARLETELLLAAALNIPRYELYLNLDLQLCSKEFERFQEAFNNRQRRLPLQYILGKQGFRYLELVVEQGVFIPRPETEMLVEEAVKIGQELSKPLTAVDVGTGSGAIALSLAKEIDNIEVYALDSSDLALKTAYYNAVLNGLQNKIIFKQSNLLAELPPELSCKVDLIVSNPPYIPSSKIELLPPEVRLEPREALDGGSNGLRFYRPLALQAFSFLKRGGCLLVEVGHSAHKVAGMFRERGFKGIKIVKDLNQYDRVVLGYKRSSI